MVSFPEIHKVFSLLKPYHQPTMLEQLKESTPFQQLVATLLSSRTKDTTTIPIVQKLFRKYSKPEDFLRVRTGQLAQELYGIGFYNVKAGNIKKLSKMITDDYGGKVPDEFSQLTSLPGVGRKTANCILNYAFKKPAIAVDVHVHRISNRLGWVHTKAPEQTEEALQKIVPRNLWVKVNELFVSHGQTTCRPVKPKCPVCPVRKHCNYGRATITEKFIKHLFSEEEHEHFPSSPDRALEPRQALSPHRKSR